MDYIRHDSRAQTLDPRHGIGLTASPSPLPLERLQQMIEQMRKPFPRSAGLGRAEVFNFLDREQSVSGFDDPLAQRQLTLRLPGQAGFDFLQDRRKGRSKVAFEK